MSTIGCRLREERERFGLNQTDFGAFGGVQKQAQLKYEKDERQPDAAYLAAIASMGADVLYILTGMRNENTAFSPTELAYLRNCRALPTSEARDAGLKMIVSLREAYGIKWGSEESKQPETPRFLNPSDPS
ncbi:MAG: helix-turn-helix transcriptional regulator [Gallionella sp.]|nr:helix-turn-helix transcriptional regulator [Gallionella sp.]MDD4946454.1 helix-turn-helix transcriptional regulator [Gallionella sp.]